MFRKVPTGARTSMGGKQNFEWEFSDSHQNQELKPHSLWAETAYRCPSIWLLQLSCLSWWWRNNTPHVIPVSGVPNITHCTVLPLCWEITKEWRSITLLMPGEWWRLRLCSQDRQENRVRYGPLDAYNDSGMRRHTYRSNCAGTGQLKVCRAQANYL